MKLHHRIAGLFGYSLIKTRTIVDTLERHLKELFELHAINCVIDVGANLGQYGRKLRGLGYRGRIVSFEPLAGAYAELEGASRSDPEWRVVRAALGRENATMTIHRTNEHVMSSFHVPNEFGRACYGKGIEVTGREDVEVKTLADCWPDIVEGLGEPRVYLKLDTQGHDLEVFGGAGPALDDILGLQSEISMTPIYENIPHYLAALARFEQEGFSITGLYLVSRDPKALTAIEYDCVMTRGTDG